MANGFENLKGISGLLVFLNHPMREPKFEEGTILKQEYERLVEEAWAELKTTDTVRRDFKNPRDINEIIRKG